MQDEIIEKQSSLINKLCFALMQHEQLNSFMYFNFQNKINEIKCQADSYAKVK